MRIAVVLVTYNRLDCLKIALKKYSKQTIKPEYLLVVDNASDDGTRDFLKDWVRLDEGYKKIVYRNEKNLGGSGGFDRGVQEAIKLDVDYLFLADDDAYAEPNMIEELKKGYELCSDQQPAALCTAIYNGRQHEYMHRCYIKKGLFNIKFVGAPESKYEKEYFELDVLTFVGACINRKVAEKIGPIKKEYFIYFDDSEYCMRLLQKGKIFCVPKSIMHHDVGHDRRSSWKDYYDTRNWIDLVRTHFTKRYYYGAIVKMYIKRCSFLATIFRKRSSAHRKMCKIAIGDAKENKLGLNEVYKPGYKIK